MKIHFKKEPYFENENTSDKGTTFWKWKHLSKWFDQIYFIFLKICLNGKCVIEHENSVDYEGPGFLRRSGLADVKSVDDVIQDTPAEPSNAR